MISKMQGDLHALPMSFHELPNRPPAHRSVIVYGTSSTMPKNCDQQVLSLNLPYISISPNTNLEQTKGITEATNTPNTNLNSEPLPLSTSTPHTCNGSTMKGFNKHKFQAVSFLGKRACTRRQSHRSS